ncbi:glycogen synthase [Polyangium jinanense]|uniref:Glycogen synthase n=1 Tax=Polyangium jinanense TaxID=2829994 RepID=A0A9X4AUJ2_9BACT|nr:glycogen/starch synthase [Polyangium jinanense]MDC3958350.1 glycogen synthase [Polyangium jinanense]MDC3983315.1 glycogen synthase [Polyangium jinanense]
MRLLHVAAELAPIVRFGGIADGVAGLARALARLGHDVTVVIPAPPGISLDPEIPITPGVRARVVTIPDVPAHLGIYGREGDGEHDNARRFALFARAVSAMARDFDIVHVHDWPGAAVPYLLRAAGGPGPPTVLTIHNLAFQGIFPPETLALLGLGPSHFHPGALEFHGRVNLLKAGLLAADAVTTVSPTYAREILDPAYGELLDGVLRARALQGGGSVLGIVNGIDLEAWDPTRDKALAAPFSSDDLAGKALCKRAFLAETGLDPDASRPLVASLGRIVPQKGADLVAAAIPALCRTGATIVVAGAGDEPLEHALTTAAAAHPTHARFLGPIPDTSARRLLAAADILIMPSRFEPCGVVQLEAQRYGAIPVARRTGGLTDTLVDEAEHPSRGTAFLFDAPTVDALVRAVRRALEHLSGPEAASLRRRVLETSPGWDRPASLYAHLYGRLSASGTVPCSA